MTAWPSSIFLLIVSVLPGFLQADATADEHKASLMMSFYCSFSRGDWETVEPSEVSRNEGRLQEESKQGQVESLLT